MPTILTRREGETLEIAGVTVAVAIARDKSCTLVIAGYDADELLEGEQEVRAAAQRRREEIDAGPTRRTAYRSRRSLTSPGSED